MDSLQVERRLTAVLSAWAAASVVTGLALTARPQTRAFGRQTALWGAIDGAIAGTGTMLRRRTGATDPARLRQVLRANLLLDVGYVVGGVGFARWSEKRRADGQAVVVQGLFLLALDGWAERALARAQEH